MRKRFWVRGNHKNSGYFHVLTKEIELFDREYFCRFIRMSQDRYKHLLSIVGPRLQRQKTHLGKPISPNEHLTLTLRYLTSIESQHWISQHFFQINPFKEKLWHYFIIRMFLFHGNRHDSFKQRKCFER